MIDRHVLELLTKVLFLLLKEWKILSIKAIADRDKQKAN